jgi:Protein of unknown function (DUF2490)
MKCITSVVARAVRRHRFSLDTTFKRGQATLFFWGRAVILAIIVSAPIFSQTTSDNNVHGWFMYFGDHPVSKHWGIHLEGQARRANYSTSWQQFLLRPAVNYLFTPNIMGTAGYAFAYSYPYGDHPSARKAFPENRFFEQLLIRNKVKKIAFQNRLRVEQRMVRVNRTGVTSAEQWEFRQRFRYMLRGDIPLPNKRLYVGLYDEFFINFGANRGNCYLDQNRAYGALGIKLSTFERIEVGYMYQYIPQRNGLIVENNHTLQFALFSNRPLRSSNTD